MNWWEKTVMWLVPLTLFVMWWRERGWRRQRKETREQMLALLSQRLRQKQEVTMPSRDVFNQQGVAVHGDKIRVLVPRPIMTPEEALSHAAWLVANAAIASTKSTEEIEAEFKEVLAAVWET